MLNKFRRRLDNGTIELLRHGKNYISASILVKGLSVISIPIMTRLLVPADYGIISVFGSLVTILTILFGFGIRGAVSRYYYEKNNDFGSFISTNLLFLWTWGLLLAGGILLLHNYLAVIMEIPSKLIIFGTFVGILSATFDVVYSYLQASKQSKKISKILIIRGILTLIFTISITLYLTENRYLGSIYTQMIFSGLFFIFSLLILRNIVDSGISVKYFKYSLVFGAPVVLHLLSGYILNTFDQIMINKMVGATETGLYSFAYKVGMLFQLFLHGLNQAWVPQFYEKLRDKKYNEIEVTLIRYSILISVIALFLVIFSPMVVSLLASNSYYEALPLIPIIIIGFLFQFLYTTYVNYAFYEKKTFLISIFTVIAGFINVILNYLLIPKFGYVVAAWTTVVGYIVLFVLHYINVKFVIKVENIISIKVVLGPVLVTIFIINIYIFLLK